MRWIVAAAVFVLTSPLAPASAQQLKSQIVIAYETPTNPKFAPVLDRLKQRYVLELLQEMLTPLRLPRELKVRTAQCGTPNLDYKPGGPVTICYELVEQIEFFVNQKTRDPNSRLIVTSGAVVQSVLHETSLAIFDMLQVPIWGRKDDAADRLAALIMMQLGDDAANLVMLGTIRLFQWSDHRWSGREFASAASPEYQRFFNFACIAVAANFIQFGGLVQNGVIPAFRAQQCESEYAHIRKAFNLRIMPHIDTEAMIKVKATDWVNWTPGKR
jgi:hypothetical protein